MNRMSEPEAIETHYAGCRFRSRLEARWAVFFDHLGIGWEYEPQGYRLHDGDAHRDYLPDFWLPDCGVHAEVKGAATRDEVHWLWVFSQRVGGALLLGPIPDVRDHEWDPTWLGMNTQWGDTARVGFGRWETKQRLWHEDMWIGEGWPEPGEWHQPYFHDQVVLDDDVRAAYRAARSARFEHGERG